MSTIICDAIPFCFGPAAALSVLGRELTRRGHAVQAVAAGTTHQLLSRDPRFDIIRCDDSIESRVNAVKRALRSADLYLNVMDPDTFAHIPAGRVPRVFDDFLMWMPRPFGLELTADLYLVEDFLTSAASLAALGDAVLHPRVIPPLIHAGARRVSGTRRLLVCYGGLESPLTRVGDNTYYPMIITPLILKAIRDIGFDEVIVATESRTASRLALANPEPTVQFVSMSHADYIDTLNGAELLLTTPGLYAPYEGFAAGVPTTFLPPSNYTQALQLDFFLGRSAIATTAAWQDLGIGPIDGPIAPGLSEAHGVARVLDCIEQFGRNSTAQATFVAALHSVIIRVLSDGPAIAASQRDLFLPRQGLNGAVAAADAIETLL